MRVEHLPTAKVLVVGAVQKVTHTPKSSRGIQPYRGRGTVLFLLRVVSGWRAWCGKQGESSDCQQTVNGRGW